MSKVVFQERSYATVKVGGVDQSTAPVHAGGIGPNSFPPPPVPPPPPPVKATLMSAVFDATNQVLALTFDRPVTGSNPFAQAHPFALEANGDPTFPTTYWSNVGGNTVLVWSFAGPYDDPVTLTIPSQSELFVNPVTDFTVTGV